MFFILMYLGIPHWFFEYSKSTRFINNYNPINIQKVIINHNESFIMKNLIHIRYYF